MANDSRFQKYRDDDLAPLVKLAGPGQQFTGRLVGEHEYISRRDGEEKVIPVLDLQDEHGEAFSWMASAWRALDELAKVDPKVGDWVTVIRLPDRGSSHDYSIHVGSKGAGTDAIPF
jgi:hypothetical protein